jgi:glycosyltransferase involved in cell wall biosynthesis
MGDFAKSMTLNHPMRILFNAWGDRGSVNAQNLNARDIAVRLDPKRFSVDMFCQKSPDPKLVNQDHISLIQVPRRLGSVVILSQMLRNYDAIFYMRLSRADTAYRCLRGWLPKRKIIITPIEIRMDMVGTPYCSRQEQKIQDEMMALADVSVANTEYVAQTVKDRYGVEIPVIYSGVDVDYFGKLASEQKDKKSHLRVIFAGSFQERKHPELVLEAACQWAHVEFVLIGDGPIKPLLQKLIVERNISNASLLSTKEYTEYAKLLATADIFMFPSRVEGLGKVLIESAASSIPALVFDDYHTPAVVDGVTGFQVKTFEEMLDRLRQLIENRDLRLSMGAAGLQYVKKFDWKVIVKQWEGVFENAIKRSKGAKSGPCHSPHPSQPVK